jgi:hypothetical protein
MGPSPDGKHAGPEKFYEESQLGEELAFWLSICPPNLLRIKSRVTANELGIGKRTSHCIGRRG